MASITYTDAYILSHRLGDAFTRVQIQELTEQVRQLSNGIRIHLHLRKIDLANYYEQPQDDIRNGLSFHINPKDIYIARTLLYVWT